MAVAGNPFDKQVTDQDKNRYNGEEDKIAQHRDKRTGKKWKKCRHNIAGAGNPGIHGAVIIG